MAAMKENTKRVFNYLKQNPELDLTAADVADALGLEKRQVDGIFTSAIQRKKYGERVLSERTEPDGTHTKVKLLKLTPTGMDFDPDAEIE